MFGLRIGSPAEDQLAPRSSPTPPAVIQPEPRGFHSAQLPARAARWSRAQQPLPVIAPGQVWLIEAWAAGSPLRPFELAAFTASNVAIYDSGLVEFVAGSLPLGNYAEAHRPGARPEFERALRLALDGWSVVRLIGGKSAPAARADRLRRIAQQLRLGGVAGELPVHLVLDVPGGYETTETSLSGLPDALDDTAFSHPLTAVFATRHSRLAPPRAVVDNGLAG